MLTLSDSIQDLSPRKRFEKGGARRVQFWFVRQPVEQFDQCATKGGLFDEEKAHPHASVMRDRRCLRACTNPRSNRCAANGCSRGSNHRRSRGNLCARAHHCPNRGAHDPTAAVRVPFHAKHPN